ncbi:MAG: hypothetical protein ACLQAL_02690 [Halobacteriota archaeon]
MNPITKIAKRYVNVPVRKALLLLIGVTIIISVAGCTSSTSSSPTPTVSAAPTGAATAAPTSVAAWVSSATASLTRQGYTFTSPFVAQTNSNLGTNVYSATAVKGGTTVKILAEQTSQSDATSRFNDMVSYVKGQGYSGEAASSASAAYNAWGGANASGGIANVAMTLLGNGQAMVLAEMMQS